MRKYALRILAYFLSLMIFGFAVHTLYSVNRQLEDARAALAEKESRAAVLRRENEMLRKELSAAGEKENLERIARSRLGLVYPDEKVIVILED